MVYLGNTEDKKVKVKFSKSTRIILNPLTNIPKRVVGINVFPPVLEEGTIPLTKKNVENVFKNFLAANQEYFGVNAKDLKLISATQVNNNWSVKFQQYYKGIPIYQATVGLNATANGKITSYTSNYHPQLDVPTTPTISLEQALEIAKRTYDQTPIEKLSAHDVTGMIYPEKTPTGLVYHLAWKFFLAGDRPNPDLDKYFIIDAVTEEVLLSYNVRFPGARVHGQVHARIYPENPTAPPITTIPVKGEYIRVRNVGRTTTRANGRFSKRVPSWWEIFGYRPRVTFRLDGPYAQVQDSDGSNFVVRRRCGINNPCDHTWTATDLDHINVFYHINLIHDWYRSRFGYNWRNAWDSSRQFKAEVNHTDNNAYAGSPMLFGTDPFARSSDVIYHECTHNVLVHIYGDYIGWPARYAEGYALDEGFADYFACSLTENSRHGEGYGGTRDLNNTRQYPGKNTYNIEGHTGGTIIGGAAWDLRNILMAEMGAQSGSRNADRLIFNAHQLLSTQPRDYYFSDPQESNLLVCLYLADDDNNNLEDGVPHFIEIHRAFANHNLLQAVLFNQNSFDFSANTISDITGGDLYYYDAKFWANNAGQRGVRDLGAIGAIPLDQVNIPTTGYTRFGVTAVTGHTYVSLAQQGEEGHHIVFRVHAINDNNVTIDFRYI
jgi:hypothetical protein